VHTKIDRLQHHSKSSKIPLDNPAKIRHHPFSERERYYEMIEIHKVNDDFGNTSYFLWEKLSEQYVNSFNSYDEARNYTRFLKRGGGFIDFTPAFMAKSFSLDESDDEVE
jgi:hypothetical protein